MLQPLVKSLLAVIAFLALIASASADHRVGDICRIKGQEENILHGFGLVTGLKGTGDTDMKATQRALAHYMELLGHHIGSGQTGQTQFEELKNVKNVALVYVTATVPPGGAQQGDTLDCFLSAASAKSLDGGYLMLTELFGPVPGDKKVFALAKGQVSIDDPARPQSGRVLIGCQLERKVENHFVVQDGNDSKVILVINKDHAAFHTAIDVQDAINEGRDFQSTSTKEIARAIDQVTIEVTIPPTYKDSPALFAATLLYNTRLSPPQVDTRVIINERKGIFIVGADVEIGPVAVMHKNRLIQVGDQPVNEAVPFNIRGDSSKPKLESLVAALNLLKVPASDVIDIIKMLQHKRALFGELIIE
ncbi:MAG TPA: flagellar basal body P-ring protein FlgI [Pirellulaceae bacterium]|jgi:flagellar P-ring protein precursor FlgI